MTFTASGVSYAGKQFLAGGTLSPHKSIAVLIPQNINKFFERQGQLFVMGKLPNGITANAVIYSALLVHPGIVYEMPVNAIGIYQEIQIWCWWNRAGVSFQALSY